MADAECEKVADPELESGSSERDAILKRQRQELKDLRGMFLSNAAVDAVLLLLDLFAPAKIQAMKKAVPKGDKKRKKEVSAETARLEQELQENHEREMKSMEANDRGVRSEVGGGMVGEVRDGCEEEKERGEVNEEKPAKKSRAQKRKVIILLNRFLSPNSHITHPHTQTLTLLLSGTRRRRHSRSKRGRDRGKRRTRRWGWLIIPVSGRGRAWNHN